MKLSKSKKGQTVSLRELMNIAIIVVVIALTAAFGIQVLDDTANDDEDIGSVASCGLNSTGGSGGTILYTNCGADYNATQDGILGVAKIPAKLPIIVTVVVAVIIIGLLFSFFAVTRRR